MLSTVNITDDFLRNVNHWIIKDDNAIAFSQDPEGVISETVFSRADMAKLHPMLFTVINEMCSRRANVVFDESRALGALVYLNLLVLRIDVVTFIDTLGEKHLACEVVGVNTILNEERYVQLSLHKLDVEWRYVENKQIPFVTGSYVENHDVFVKELEVHYPGWGTRLKLCNELDIHGTERMSYLFQEGALPVSKHALPEMSLD